MPWEIERRRKTEKKKKKGDDGGWEGRICIKKAGKKMDIK